MLKKTNNKNSIITKGGCWRFTTWVWKSDFNDSWPLNIPKNFIRFRIVLKGKAND